MRRPSLSSLIGLALAAAVLLAVPVAAQTVQQRVAKARAAFDAADTKTALAELDAALRIQPANETALTLRGRVLVREGRFPEALADAEKVLAKNPGNFEALNVRGVARRESGNDLEGALNDFSRAAQISPDYYFAHFNLGLTYARMNLPGEALAAFARASETNPKSAAPFQQRAVLYSRYRRNGDAVVEFGKAIALDSRSAALFAGRAYSYFRLWIDGDAAVFAKMTADTEAALALAPENPVALSLRGVIRYSAKDCPGATADADRAARIDPKNFLPYVVRGFCRGTGSDPEGSFEQFDEAFRLAPNDKAVAGWRERSLARAKGPRALAAKQAIVENVRLAIAEDPWEFGVYDASNDLIRRVDPTGDSRLLQKLWEGLIAENGGNICAMRFLGEYRARDYVDMISYWDGALAKYDGRNGTECAAQIAFRIGREYATRNRFNEAERYFARAKELKPDLKNLDGNIAANRAEKAEQEKPIPIVPPQSVSRSNVAERAWVDPLRRKAAIDAYNRIHPLIESDILQLNAAISKWNRAGAYNYLYKGTYQRIQQITERVFRNIDGLIKTHGDHMPPEMRNHLEADRRNVAANVSGQEN